MKVNKAFIIHTYPVNKQTQARSVRKRGQIEMTGHAWYDNNYEGKAILCIF